MIDFKMELTDHVRFIIKSMENAGFKAHVVGGSVRDSLIGRELGDYDITTNALPEQTKAVFADKRTVDTGIKHGTVTLVLDSVPYEITTYRVDGDYKDNRHPESVTFSSMLVEDLERRDFTVNAMAYDPTAGLCDPFGGRQDAEAGLIRAVGDPNKRFDEDALRILRALRFASVLGFEIEEHTAQALRELAPRLSSISKERIYTELKKLIMGVDALRIIGEYPEVFAPLFEGLAISRLPLQAGFDTANIFVRFASLFAINSASSVTDAERAFSELKTDKFTRSRVIDAISAYEELGFIDETEILLAVVKYGKDVVKDAFSLGLLSGKYTPDKECVLLAALDSGLPESVSELAVRGGDIAALGIRGEEIGKMLERILIAVIKREIANEKQAIIKFAVEHKDRCLS